MTNEEELYKAAHDANRDNNGEPITMDGTFESAFILGADYQKEKEFKKVYNWVFQNIGYYIEYVNGVASFHNTKFKEALKQAIEEAL